MTVCPGMGWPSVTVATRFSIPRSLSSRSILFLLAPGPHPRRDPTLTPRLGFPFPRLGVAAGAFHVRWGPTPSAYHRSLTLAALIRGDISASQRFDRPIPLSFVDPHRWKKKPYRSPPSDR